MKQIAEFPTKFNPHTDAANTLRTVAESCHQLAFSEANILSGRPGDTDRGHALRDVLRTNKIANFLGSLPKISEPEHKPLALWLNAYREQTTLLNAGCLSHVAKISDVLSNAGIEFVVFKGVIQQKILYGSYFVKPTGDVDLLVHRRDFFRARQELVASGFSPAANSSSRWWISFLGEQHLRTQALNSPAIDLHYRIQQPGSPQPANTGAFIKRKQFVNVGGIEVPFMHPQDFLLMSSISIAKAMFNREPCGGHIADIHASLCNIRRQDIPALFEFSKQQGLFAVLQLGLRSAKVTLNVDHPMTNSEMPEILPSLSDASLKKLLLLADKTAPSWPKRRRVLWELCERSPLKFARECGWAISADICRRITQGTETTSPLHQMATAQKMGDAFMHAGTPEIQSKETAHSSAEKSVCVIIAARNAEDTIARAVTSALNQQEVSEVIVVDDDSTDNTAASARLADDGSNRLKLIQLSQNVGPGEARNIAIDNSSAPLIAVLDADDFFLKDRFDLLINDDEWDFIGDNIVFLNEESIGSFETTELLGNSRQRTSLSFAEFVSGNISKRGLTRGELGFLKPVMKREFLRKYELRYKPDLRLGEDYDLYSRALLKGASFKISPSLGYGAVIRSNSLSAMHRTSDLKALANADRSMLEDHVLSAEERSELTIHLRHIQHKYALREFLDLKKGGDFLKAIRFACSSPSIFFAVFSGIALDKISVLGLVKHPKLAENIYRNQRVLFPINGIGASQ